MLIPVQFGPLDGVHLFFFFVLAGLLAGAWVYLDATKRDDDNALLWAAVVAFLFLFYFVTGFAALIIYVVLRGRDGEQPPTAKPESAESSSPSRYHADRQLPGSDRPDDVATDRERTDDTTTDRERTDDTTTDRERTDDTATDRERTDDVATGR